MNSQSEPIRVGVVCDFVEEGWPSMEFAAEMLLQSRGNCGARPYTPVRLCPTMRRRTGCLPWAGASRTARNAERALGRYWDYPQWLKKHRDDFDLFHIVDHSYAHLVHELPAARTIVTCHDLDAFACLFNAARSPRQRLIRAMARRTLDGFRAAARVICVSEATRAQILSYDLLPPDRLVVINNVVHPTCSPLSHAPADAEAAEFLGPIRNDQIDILHVGSVIPRKRIDVLLRTIAGVSRERPSLRLIRVGGPFTAEQSALAADLGVRERMLELPFLERETLAAVYRRVALVVLTSEAEGFGLPVIETMACGAAVATSDLPALREVGGVAAAYCRVGDVDAFKTTILEMLRERETNPRQWEQRRRLGLEQAARFDSVRAEEQLAEVYRQVLQVHSADLTTDLEILRRIETLGLQ